MESTQVISSRAFANNVPDWICNLFPFQCTSLQVHCKVKKIIPAAPAHLHPFALAPSAAVAPLAAVAPIAAASAAGASYR
jgi:hypothetical protein